jgi:hypothetical protein
MQDETDEQSPQTPAQPGPSEAEIERLAYELWETRGRPNGSSELDWLRAEQILREQYAAR